MPVSHTLKNHSWVSRHCSFACLLALLWSCGPDGSVGFDEEPSEPFEIVFLNGGGTTICGVSTQGRIHCMAMRTHYAWFTRMLEGVEAEEPWPALEERDFLFETARLAGIDDAVKVYPGSDHICAIRQGGRLSCMGVNVRGETGVNPGEFAIGRWHDWREVEGIDEPVVDVLMLSRTTCALDESGSVWCFGDNRYNELGRGVIAQDLDFDAVPARVANLPPIASFDASSKSRTACAYAFEDNALWCWGENAGGLVADVGEHSTFPSARRLEVPDGTKRTWSTGYNACVEDAERAISCMGANTPLLVRRGSIARGPYIPMFEPIGLASVDRMWLGGGFSCASDFAGELVCWGKALYNYYDHFTRIPGITATRDTHVAFASAFCAHTGNDTLRCLDAFGTGETLSVSLSKVGVFHGPN